MTIKTALAALTMGVVGLWGGSEAVLAQTQEQDQEFVLEAALESPGDIRFIENREDRYQQDLDTAIEQVGFSLGLSPEVVDRSQALSETLDEIGVGENSQVATTLCTIGEEEVPSRRETFRQAYFHLNTVEELLAELIGQPATAIDTALMSNFSTDQTATYLYIHATLVENECVPPLVVANLFE